MTAEGTHAAECDRATRRVWAVLGGPPALPDRVRYGPPGGLPAAVPVTALARTATAVCSLAAAELLATRGRLRTVPAVRVDDDAVAAAFTSERHLLVDGRPGTTFAPLSRFWPAADGWLRTHANYPHHRARLLAALGVTGHGDSDSDALVSEVAAELAARPGEDTQEAVRAAGGLAVAVRTAAEWAASAPGRSAAARPLIEHRTVADGPVRALPPAGLPAEGCGCST